MLSSVQRHVSILRAYRPRKHRLPMFSSLTSVTMRCTTPMCVMRRDFISLGQSMGKSATSPWETATRASSGQGKNQSIVGPEINPGNFLCFSFRVFKRALWRLRSVGFFFRSVHRPAMIGFSSGVNGRDAKPTLCST